MQYQQAVLAPDGATAAGLLSAASIEYYGELVDAALHASRADLDAMRAIDVVTVLLARHEYPRRNLAALDGRAFLELAINDGLIGESTVAGLTFDRAEITGKVGRLHTSEPNQTLRTLDLRLESTGWKIHLVTLLAEVGRQVEQAIAAEGLSPTAAALELMQQRYPDAGPKLFDPPA